MSGRSAYFGAATKPRPESITHAVNRMREQGYSDSQIAGQVRKWHPDWDNADIAAHIVKNVQTRRATNAQAVRAAETVRGGKPGHAPARPAGATVEKAKPSPSESTRPFYPGQKPDRQDLQFKPFPKFKPGQVGGLPLKPGVGVTRTPLYSKPKSEPPLQTVLGGPAKGQSLEQSRAELEKVYAENHPAAQQILESVANAMPGVALAKGIRDRNVHLGTAATEALNDVSSGLLPAGKVAGVVGTLGTFRKLRAARATAETLDVGKGAARAAGKLPTAAEVGRARAEIARLTELHSQVSAKHEEILTRATHRPRTVAEAQKRLSTLEAEHNKALDKIASDMFGPVDKREVAFRNAENARAARQAAGRTRNGKLSGASGRKSIVRPTVKEERRREAERQIEQAIAKNPDHPVASAWRARSDEIDQLREALNPDLFEQVDPSKLGVEAISGRSSKAAEAAAQRRLERLGRIEGRIAEHQALIDWAGEMSAREKIQSGLPVARITRGKQEVGYTPERAARAAKAEQAMQSIGGIEGHAAAKRALRGELPKVQFQGFGELTPDNLEEAFRTVQTHPHLMPYQKIRVNDALQAAVNEGKVPTRSDLDLIEHVFGKDLSGTLNDPTKLSAWSKAIEVLNVPRSLMASFDVSAPFRQGLVIGARHPGIFFRNFAPMFKALGSEGAYRAVMQDIVSRPSFPMMQEAKLALTDFEHGLQGAEEQFIGQNYAERIPVVGKGVRGSGRAYTAFLNKTRADTFDHLIRVAQGQGVNVQNEEFLRSLGRYINSATGRGTYGSRALEQALPAMNAVFFSPRLLASRLNFLNPAWYLRQDPFVRRQALRAALQTVGAGSTVLGLAALGGAKVGQDPTSADFGKIRLGDTRVDIWGGFQQPIRLVAQLTEGKVTSSTTGKELRLGPEGPGKLSRRDILERFFVGKLAPTPSFGYDFLTGSNLIGQPFDLKSEVAARMVPLLMQDARDLYNEQHGGMNGIEAALAGYGLGAFGVGIQSYGDKPKESKKAKAGSAYFGGADTPATSSYFGGGQANSSSGYFGH